MEGVKCTLETLPHFHLPYDHTVLLRSSTHKIIRTEKMLLI